MKRRVDIGTISFGFVDSLLKIPYSFSLVGYFERGFRRLDYSNFLDKYQVNTKTLITVLDIK